MYSLFKFQRSRWFWKLRYYKQISLFYIKKSLFKQGQKIRNAKERFSITKELSTSIIPLFSFALLLVVLLEIGERFLFNFSMSFSIFTKVILGYLNIYYTLNQPSGPMLTLLSIIASISGVFLGLYFTALSVVTSSFYARVPSNLRELLLKEKVGNQYIRILTILTSISIILLGYRALGGHFGILNSLLVTTLGCFGILCFVQLGSRVFYFFDPAKLGGVIFYDLNDNIRLATIRGFRWADPSFQAHYQKLAENNISTLSTLIKLCSEETQLQKQPLSTILQKTIHFLEIYEQQRSFIPTDSLWYSRIPRYKSWFFYDSSALSIALETQTAIQPEMVPNPYWLEDDVIGILSPALEKVLQRENLEIVYETLNALNIYLEHLGSNYEFKKGVEIINKLNPSIEKYFGSRVFTNLDNSNEKIGIVLFDIYGLTIMSLALGFFKEIRNLKVDVILKRIDTINWLNDKSIYEKKISPPVLPRVEFVHKRMKFEKDIEGKIISPNWYVRQLIVMRYLELFLETANELFSSLENFFVSKSNFLLSQKSFILVAQHSQRGLEMCNKMRAHFPSLKSVIEELDKMAINRDLPWPKWDWDRMNDKINKSHDKLIENLAKCIPVLSFLEHGEVHPDLFGHTYNVVCLDCYDSLLSKNPEKFKIIFPLLFIGSLAAHDKLGKQLKGEKPDKSLVFSFEPLLDIMSLSGYAKIYSELYGIPEIWSTCITTWDKYFESDDNAKNWVKALIELYKFRKLIFGISARDVLRANWKINLRNKLSEMNLIDDSYFRVDDGIKITHKSPLIKTVCRGRYAPHVDGAEVFIILYLLKRPEAEGIEYQDMWGLAKAMTHEENSKKNGDRHEEGSSL